MSRFTHARSVNPAMTDYPNSYKKSRSRSLCAHSRVSLSPSVENLSIAEIFEKRNHGRSLPVILPKLLHRSFRDGSHIRLIVTSGFFSV